jgi:hypothetical protein
MLVRAGQPRGHPHRQIPTNRQAHLLVVGIISVLFTILCAQYMLIVGLISFERLGFGPGNFGIINTVDEHAYEIKEFAI